MDKALTGKKRPVRISRVRGILGSNQNLAAHARKLNLGKYIGNGYYTVHNTIKMASAMEALVAAVYIDSKKNINLLRRVMTHLGLNIHVRLNSSLVPPFDA